MKRIILTFTLILIFLSCGIKSKKLTREVWEKIKTGRELKGEEQAYLNAFIFTHAKQDSLFDMNRPFEIDVTVKEAIEEGKKLTHAYRESLKRKPGKMTTKPAQKSSPEVTK